MIEDRSEAGLIAVATGCGGGGVEIAAARPLTLGPWMVGRPVALPPTSILLALSSVTAATTALPETRIPAVPASMVPRGASRKILDLRATLEVFSTPMPAPLT